MSSLAKVAFMGKHHNVGVDLKKMISDLEPGVERAVLQIISFHVGRDKAIAREDFLSKIGQLGFSLGEREMRVTINQLRKSGFPICATGGKGGGYWLAGDWAELKTFCDIELHSRAIDMLETEKQLLEAGSRYWGAMAGQLALPKC